MITTLSPTIEFVFSVNIALVATSVVLLIDFIFEAIYIMNEPVSVKHKKNFRNIIIWMGLLLVNLSSMLTIALSNS